MFRRRKEMEAVSSMLEQLLNGEKLQISGQYKDDLPSKVRHQVMRLSEVISGKEAQLKKERNDIREMIAEIAHQMRHPLANMESYLELLSVSETEEERQKYLAVLKETECKLHFLTESFIKMARLDHKAIQIRTDAASLSETILQSILQAQKAADAKNIFIDFSMGKERPVPHDPNWLGEAIFNLLENSVKYSPADSAIQVAAIYDEMYARITISDSGIGIREGEESRIFQRFYRGKETNGQPGFGLGLYLTREIVLLHGGFVKAKRKRQGMEISIFLP